jgi:hypothetical protein
MIYLDVRFGPASAPTIDGNMAFARVPILGEHIDLYDVELVTPKEPRSFTEAEAELLLRTYVVVEVAHRGEGDAWILAHEVGRPRAARLRTEERPGAAA